MVTHSRVSLTLVLVLALPGFSSAAELGFVADLDLQVHLADWPAALANPQWTEVPLTGCTTTTEWITVDQCAPAYDHLVCEKTVCTQIDSDSIPAQSLVTTTFSDDCFVCVTNPECCDSFLDTVVDYDDEDGSVCALSSTLEEVVVVIEHHTNPVALPALNGSAGYSGARSCSFSFQRPPGSPGTTNLEIELTASYISAMVAAEELANSVGYSRFRLMIESPQLGTLFETAVEVTTDGVTIVGDIPASFFDVMIYAVQLVDTTMPTLVVPVPASLDEVDVQVQIVFEGRSDWDLNGNGASDIVDTDLGVSLDEDRDGFPDECQELGVLSHTIGAAQIATGAGNDAVIISSLDPSEESGLNNLLGAPVGFWIDVLSIFTGSGDDVVGFGVQPRAANAESSVPVETLSLNVVATAPGQLGIDLSDLGEDGGSLFIDGVQQVVDGSDFLIWQLCDGAGELPWPTHVSAEVFGDPLVVGFRIGLPEGTCILMGGTGNDLFASEMMLLPNADSSNVFESIVNVAFTSIGISEMTLANGLLLPPAQCPVFWLRGDFNGDGVVSLADMLALLQHLFLGGPPATPVFDAGDVDGNGAMGLLDVLYGLTYMFTDGPPPPAPFPELGCPE